jgi:hypothetical protein
MSSWRDIGKLDHSLINRLKGLWASQRTWWLAAAYQETANGQNPTPNLNEYSAEQPWITLKAHAERMQTKLILFRETRMPAYQNFHITMHNLGRPF